LREASLAEEEHEEAATTLVTRDLMRKIVEEEAVVKKALEIAAEISVPSEVLMKESSDEAAQKVVELTENLEQMVKSSDVLKANEEVQMKKVATSEAAQGNPDSLHSANIIEIESSSESFQTSTSTSTSTSRFCSTKASRMAEGS